MDKIEKVLKKLSHSERKKIKAILAKIVANNISTLDVKKLKGRDDIFRVRIGDLRIIYRKDQDGVFVLSISRRNEHTYKMR